MKFNKTRQVADSANTGTAVAEAPATETPDVPFVNGQRTLTEKQTLKPRGKSGEKEHPGVEVEIARIEIDNLSAFVSALLETVGNDEKAALEVANSALSRAATQRVYDATFGDEIKIRAMIRTMVAAGLPEAAADATAREVFAKAKATAGA